MRFGYRLRLRYACAWMLGLLSLAGCQPNSGSLASWYFAQTAEMVAIPSIPGTVQAVVGGTQTLHVTFSTSEFQRITDLQIISGLSLPAGWNGPSSFGCTQLARDVLCQLTLAYTPTASSSGTLALNFSYTDQGGHTHSGNLSIPYRSSSHNNIVATAAPSGQITAVIGAGSQSVALTFTTDDGSPASHFSLTSNLRALPAGWNSSAGSFNCASVSSGNGCQLALSYAPSAVGSGTLTLNYSYTDDAGQDKSGAVNIPYASASANSNSVLGSVSPSGQITASLGGSESVTVSFDTNDGSLATHLSVTGDLASLPAGWNSSAGSFNCASVSSGNGCELTLTYAPTAVGSGTVSVPFSYTNDAGQLKTGVVSIPYVATANDNVVGTAAPSGQINAVIGAGSQSVTVTFTTDDGNAASGLSVSSNLNALPAGWSSSGSSFSCASVSTGDSCQLDLTYAPTSTGGGTVTLSYNYFDDAGNAKSGSVYIRYVATTHDNVVGTAAPSGQIAVPVNASQAVSISFDTDDGNTATALSITSDLTSLPAGWSSSANSFSCGSVSSGNGCQLSLSYAPTAAASGTLTLNYSYLDDTGASKSGSVSIPYIGTTNDNVIDTVAPSGTIASIVNASQAVTVSFDTDDGNTATNLAITSDLSSLPAGWSSSSGGFSCNSVSSGNGCQLSLTYAPTSVGSGTLSLQFSYTDNAGGAKSGYITISYVATTHDNALGTVAPSGQVAVTVNATQAVSVTFDTDDGNVATGLSITTNLASLPAGWSSSSSSFSCASVSSGNACQLSLTYAPVAIASGTLTLYYGYSDNAGSVQSGSVSIPYTATTNDHIVGTASPSVTVTTDVNNSLPVSVTFDTDDGNVATGLSLTTNLASLPAGWSSGSGSFSCASVSTGSSCQLSLIYAPTSAASGTLTLYYSYTNNAGSAQSGSVSIPYAANATIGGTVTGLNGTLSLQDNGADTLMLSSNGAFTLATALANGASYNVTVSSQPVGQTCNVVNGAGTVSTDVTSVSITCTVNTYSIGGAIGGLSQSGLVLTDNGGDPLSLGAGVSSFTFATPLPYGASYAVAVNTQPTGQTCSTANASGTVTATVSSVSVSCTTNSYSIGGSISGLSQSGLILTDNAGNALTVSSGATSFTFSTQLSYGAPYAIAVSTQPTGESCSVSSGSGTVTGTVTSVSITCTTNTYSIGGTISGLTASGLSLTDNGGNTLSVNAGASSFDFSTQLAYGATYAVAVSTQPTGQTCTVSNSSGTVSTTVTSVSLSCVNSYTIGGTISGLTMSSVVLASGSQTVTVSSGSGTWVFTNSFVTGTNYSVTVQMQPAGEFCQVTSGASGTLTSNVSNVTVVCSVTYGYSYRKSITVNNAQVSGGPQTNYPFLFSSTNSDFATVANGGKVNNANGYDIIFVALDDTTCGGTGTSPCTLNFEVENYNAATGQLIAWVNVPSINSSTVIYIYFGNSSITTSQAQPTSVWDSHYALVSHLGNGTTLNINDSTSNGNNGANGGLTAATGEIGGGATSAANTDYLSYGTGSSLANFTTLSYEFWMKPNSLAGFPAGRSNNNAIRFNPSGTSLTYRHQWSGGLAGWSGSTNLSSGVWYHVVVTYDGSSTSNKPQIYINGVPDTITTSTAASGTLSNDGTLPLVLAHYNTGGGIAGATGTYDEFRYSNIVRSAGWVATEYNNESAPASFYTLGSTVTM